MVVDISRLEEWLKVIVSVIGSLTFLYKLLVKPIREIKTQNEQQSIQIKSQSDKIDAIIEDVAFLQGDRLQQAYKNHIKNGWCSASEKRDLERWYTAYKNAGHNHLAEHYIDEIFALPDNPQN